MYELKTKPTRVSVASYLAAIDDEERRRDCKAIVAMMKRITGCPPKMWGPTIIGFDSYHYRYASGHEGDMCCLGFASRGKEIVLYLLDGHPDAKTKALLKELGPHRKGKVCLYIKRLADVNVPILEKLAARSYADTSKRHPKAKA